MKRDEKMKSIRPVLKLADKNKKPLELFQNETLRPILKLQHEITYSFLLNHKNYKPEQLSNAPRQQYETFIVKYIQTNLDLKNQLLGAIVGLFSADEITFYMLHRKELNKRIIRMQMNRFVDRIYSE